ncbi:cupin-like domain-containing protein [Paraliomyxa miuraensis]|uniref:cupin-like domain-containing protein n=1 Tax=Paraliomyxa miuraensis TaxID=376150 RepID=UPI00224D24F2|nr:cupin-like domain-containing protein [Paraliomyxa miuraensis]MCX4247770.1 cupin-like domain-containing protein [Paraliomyxa miuraensis]
MSITPHDLIHPLDVDAFVRDHVLAGRHHLSPPRESVLAELATVPELQCIDRLLRTPVKVQLFGSKGFRAPCPNHAARAFLDEGYVLYVTRVHTAVPAARDLVEGICTFFGVHPRYVRLEAFAGNAGAISSMHYDHDVNFHVLLRGHKRWRVEANAHIDNPLEAHHAPGNPKDELHAKSLPLPRTFCHPQVLSMAPGCCLFLPSGYWHEVESLGSTFALNIVIDPPRVHELVAQALENKLGWTSRHRGFALGLLGDGAPPMLQAHAVATFEEVRKAALELLSTLEPEDASVALEEQRYRWSVLPADRRVVLRDGELEGLELDLRFRALMEQLVRLEGSFDLRQLCAWAPEVSAEEMLALVLELVARDILERDAT